MTQKIISYSLYNQKMMRKSTSKTQVFVTFLVVCLGIAATSQYFFAPRSVKNQPSQPSQPASGPGGAGYEWQSVTTVFHDFQDNSLDYYVYEPDEWQGTGAQPTTLPVVVYLHGWMGHTPDQPVPDEHVTHIVKKGNIVVWPKFYECSGVSACGDTESHVRNAAFSIRDALKVLNSGGGNFIPNQRGIGIVGASMGGGLAANVANRWQSESLPKPLYLYSFIPHENVIDTNLSGIPTSTKVVCVVGNEDTSTGRLGCDLIWNGIRTIPEENKNYLWVKSDTFGNPDFISTHSGISEGIGAYFLAWKLNDGLRDCTFFESNCEYALGNTAEQRFMGLWSNGVPVAEPTVWSKSDSLPACPTGASALGCF